MTKKDRLIKIINRKEFDYLPSQIDSTPEMREKIKNILGIEDNEVDTRLGNHIKYKYLNDKTFIDNTKGIQFDVWGVGWDLISTEGFHIRHHPLSEIDRLYEYKIPEINNDLLKNLGKQDYKKEKEYFILLDIGFTLFERCWLLRGFENTLLDFYFQGKKINYLLDKITEFHIKIGQKIIEQSFIDGVYTGDDFGTQRGLIISPETWRKFFKNRYKKIWAVYKRKNIPIFHHSCGNILEIIPDLIEIGLNVLSPIQPEAMKPEILSKEFGKDLTFFGGISTQHALPFSTPLEVKKEVINRIKVLGKYGSYIISPSHEVTSDCKKDNFLMLLETLENYKGFKDN